MREFTRNKFGKQLQLEIEILLLKIKIEHITDVTNIFIIFCTAVTMKHLYV